MKDADPVNVLEQLAGILMESQKNVVQSQEALARIMQGQERIAEALAATAKALSTPRTMIPKRDAQGKIISVEEKFG